MFFMTIILSPENVNITKCYSNNKKGFCNNTKQTQFFCVIRITTFFENQSKKMSYTTENLNPKKCYSKQEEREKLER